VLEGLEDRLAPAAWLLTVNSTADNTTDTTHLTLRDAVAAINAGSFSSLSDTQSDQVNGIPGNVDKINFSVAGTITLSMQGDDTVGPSALRVDKPLIIDGTGGVTLSGGGQIQTCACSTCPPPGTWSWITSP
jgi:hypothetical protein